MSFTGGRVTRSGDCPRAIGRLQPRRSPARVTRRRGPRPWPRLEHARHPPLRRLPRARRGHRLPGRAAGRGHARLLRRRSLDAVVGGRALGDGDPGQRHHVHRHHRTRRTADGMRFVQFYFGPAGGHGDPGLHAGAAVPPSPRLHGLRVPRPVASTSKTRLPGTSVLFLASRAACRSGRRRSTRPSVVVSLLLGLEPAESRCWRMTACWPWPTRWLGGIRAVIWTDVLQMVRHLHRG